MKKFLPYILILIALVGFFSSANKTYAADPPDGNCAITIETKFDNKPPETTIDNRLTKETACSYSLLCQPNTQSVTCSTSWKKGELLKSSATSDKTPFDAEVEDASCGVFRPSAGCIVKLLYYALYMPATFFLYLSAKFFNYLMAVSLDGSLLDSPFIRDGWTVVRDLSNIFFILIMLYIALKVIIDAGGHGTKQMIGKVIIMALLINFSMFFTKIVVDSSNILALVFYSKLSVIDKNGKPINNDDPASGESEKNLSGAMYNSFDPTKLLKPAFFEKTRQLTVLGNGQKDNNNKTSPGILMGIIILSVAIMVFASYCFFASGIFFVGRLIELFILIIFSPFAFMSWTTPILEGTEYLGWKSWSSRLITVSFMAPIFMFFLYFIFMLLKANPFSALAEKTNGNAIQMLLGITVPAMLILILLLKAKDFAKKGSGEIGGMVMSGAKLAAGLAVGVASGGTALAGRAVIARGAAVASRSNYEKVKIEHNQSLDAWERGGKVGAKPKFIETLEKYQATSPSLGGKINLSQLKAGEVDHARHEIDETKKKAGLEGVDDKFLSGVEKQKIETTFIKEKRSDIESSIKKGYDASGDEVEVTGNGITAVGENDYKAQRRQDVINEVKRNNPQNVDASENLDDQGKKEVEDKLNSEFNEILRSVAARMGKEKFEHLQEEAKEKVGMVTRMTSRSTSGTYDVRNLSTLKTDKREGLGAKATIGLIAAVAMGMRMGLKKTSGIEAGNPQGNFLRDMGQTVAEALRHAKLDVKLGGDEHEATHGPAAHAHAPDNEGHH